MMPTDGMPTDGIAIDFTDGDSYAAVLGSLEGWTVSITDRSGAQRPPCVIRSTHREFGLLVADADVNGAPLPDEDARHWLDFETIARITIL